MRRRRIEMVNRYGSVWLGVVVALCASSFAQAQKSLGPWPADQDPKTVGRKVVNNLLERKPATRPQGYQETCTAYGAMRFCDAIGDKELLNKVIARYAVMLEPDSPIVRKRPS